MGVPIFGEHPHADPSMFTFEGLHLAGGRVNFLLNKCMKPGDSKRIE